MIYLYCDGACSGNQSKDNYGGWGSVLVYGKHVKELSGGEANTTNNIMELTAMIEGLAAIKVTDKPVAVFSDSAYIINCFHQKWYVNWEKNGWKNSKKKPVENQALWQSLLTQMRRFERIHFFKVKGHVDIDDEATIKKWHKKFELDYDITMPYAVYKEGIAYNNRADALATAAAANIKGA